MAQFAYDETTGQEFILDERSGEWVPFTDAESTLDSILINAGGALNQLGRGVADVFGGDRQQLQQSQREQDALLAPLRQARPVSSFVGEALPGLATAPIGGTALAAGTLGLGRSLALSGGLGALEGYLRLDPNSVDQTMSSIVGLAGGLLGEGGGRMAGRVANAIKGAGQSLARSDAASSLAERGLQSLPSERLNVPGQNIGPLQRLEQGAQTGVFTPSIFREIGEERAGLMTNTAARAVGLQGAEDLGPDVLAEASENISRRFQAIASEAVDQNQGFGGIEIGEELADRILKTKGQVRELFGRGRFQGLDPEVGGNAITPPELLIARRALAQDAAQAAGKGQHELAEDIFSDVDQLDEILGGLIGQDRVGDFAQTRQLYRNLQILMKPGVISDAGQANPKALQRALRAGTGYGNVYRTGDTRNLLPETAELFDVARTLADPSLQPFRSSGTAENQAIRDLGTALATATTDPVAGGVGLATRLAAPIGLSALGGTNRAANAFGGLLMPGGSIFGRAGGEIGPGLLDAMLLESLNNETGNQ